MYRRFRKTLVTLVLLALALCCAPKAALAAGSDITKIDSVAVRVAPPVDGDTTKVAPVVFVDCDGCSVEVANWCTASGSPITSPTTFKAYSTYYMNITLLADRGYAFQQAAPGTEATVDGGSVLAGPDIINSIDGDNNLYSRCELRLMVTAIQRSYMFVACACDTNGTLGAGGTYWVSYPDCEWAMEEMRLATNNFVYAGDHVFLSATPDKDQRFVGWFQGNVDAHGELPYSGKPISTNPEYEFVAPLAMEMPCLMAVFESGNPFIDVTVNTPHYSDILWLANTGISAGWDTDAGKEFRPMDEVARADMAAFLFRLAKSWSVVDESWQPSSASAFKDVNAKTSHRREILWLAESGISKGWEVKGGKEFRPYAKVARADMAAFMERLATLAKRKGKTQVNKKTFKDVTTKTAHCDEIWWLAANGISEGWKVSGGKEFRPLVTVKRCDMAAFLHRMDDVH